MSRWLCSIFSCRMSKEISWPKVIWWCLPFWLLPHHPSVWLRKVEAIEEVSYVMSYNWICSTNLPLLLLKSEQTSILISSDISISRGWYMSCDASLVTWKHERYPSFLTDNSSQNEINMPTHNAYHCIFFSKGQKTKIWTLEYVQKEVRSHSNSPSSQVSLWKNWWKRYFQSLFTLKQSNILCIFSFSCLRKKLCPLGSFLNTHERGIYLGQDEVVWKETGWPSLLMTQLCH